MSPPTLFGEAAPPKPWSPSVPRWHQMAGPLTHQCHVAAELPRASAEWVCRFDFVRLFATQRQSYFPVEHLVLGEIVELIVLPTVYVTLPEFIVVFGFKHDRAPPVEDLEFVALDEVNSANDGFEPVIDAISISIACRGESIGDKN